MFGSVERKLALLNVSVVVAIVAMIGVGTWILLRQALDQEANTSLEDRIESAEAPSPAHSRAGAERTH